MKSFSGISLGNATVRFMTASGALGFDGQGWPWEQPLKWLGNFDPRAFDAIVLKTLTLQPLKGNVGRLGPLGLLRTVKMLPGGTVNAVGLRNPGLSNWLTDIAPSIIESLPIVISILGNSVAEIKTLADIIDRARRYGPLENRNVLALELNVSCPNVSHGDWTHNLGEVEYAVEFLRNTTHLPIIAKLGYDPEKFYRRVADIVTKHVAAFAINSVPWRYFSEGHSPLDRFGGGGVSGQVVQPITWLMTNELAEYGPTFGPSVWSLEDVDAVIDRGARAISFGSVFIAHPTRPNDIVKAYQPMFR